MEPESDFPAVDHYTDRAFALVSGLPDMDPEWYSYSLLCIQLLERAIEAELHDPDPLDTEVGLDEPNWLLRLDQLERFDPYGTAPDSIQA